MNNFTKNTIVQKIIIVLVFLTIFNKNNYFFNYPPKKRINNKN